MRSMALYALLGGRFSSSLAVQVRPGARRWRHWAPPQPQYGLARHWPAPTRLAPPLASRRMTDERHAPPRKKEDAVFYGEASGKVTWRHSKRNHVVCQGRGAKWLTGVSEGQHAMKTAWPLILQEHLRRHGRSLKCEAARNLYCFYSSCLMHKQVLAFLHFKIRLWYTWQFWRH